MKIAFVLLSLVLLGCVSGNLAYPVCGNNVKEIGESCDNSDLGQIHCTDLGYRGGILKCTSDCQYDTSSCFRVIYRG